MLDQSFSYENFRILLDVENRKGRYLEDKEFFDSDIFKKSREISDLIIKKNKEIRDESFKVCCIHKIEDRDYTLLDNLKDEKEELKKNREKLLENILIEIAAKTDIENYDLKIKKGQIKWGSQLFEVEHNPENYFVTKQLQRNIYKTFKVKQASRKVIIEQLTLLLDDGFPKIIIRTDISKFYESIPHKELLEKIEENSLLSYPSKKIIKRVLNQYWELLVADGVKLITDERVGIPRGIGFSAYLSELYLRSFDNKIKSLPNVTYYSRYVDDIIIIITPKHRNEFSTVLNFEDEIKKILLDTTNLIMNTSKTNVFDLTKENEKRTESESYHLTYLGYKFEIAYSKKLEEQKSGITREFISKGKLKVFMSEDKLQRFKNKIDNSFSDYQTFVIKYSAAKNATERMLYKRIKFLTNNHHLSSRKKNVFIGVYFSNQFLTNPFSDLVELDTYLKNKLATLPPTFNSKILAKMNSLSFEKGFKSKSIEYFNNETFANRKMLQIWKNL